MLCPLFHQHNGNSRKYYTVICRLNSCSVYWSNQSRDACNQPFSVKLRSHKATGFSNWLHWVCDQGAFKVTNLVVKRLQTDCPYLLFVCHTNKLLNQPQKIWTRTNKHCDLSTNNPSIVPTPPIMSSVSWWSVTSDPFWGCARSLRGCHRLTHSNHGGFKRGWPFNRRAASGWLTAAVVFPLWHPLSSRP